MIPASFEYHRPATLDDALELLADLGDDAKVLAGGQSLLPMMKLRLAVPEAVVDIGRLAELRYVRDEGDHLAIGALSRHHDLVVDPVVATRCPILAATARVVGDRQIRHRGTLGGTLAHGDPAGDLPAVAVCLDATLVVVGPSGQREIPATELYESFLETTLGPDELVVEVRVPVTTGGWSYQKFTKRAQDWAVVGVAAATTAGTTRVALVNMGSTTLRAAGVERALAEGATAAEAAEHADEDTEPPDDLNGSEEYRRHLARVLTRRALEETLA